MWFLQLLVYLLFHYIMWITCSLNQFEHRPFYSNRTVWTNMFYQIKKKKDKRFDNKCSLKYSVNKSEWFCYFVICKLMTMLDYQTYIRGITSTYDCYYSSNNSCHKLQRYLRRWCVCEGCSKMIILWVWHPLVILWLLFSIPSSLDIKCLCQSMCVHMGFASFRTLQLNF